MATIRDGKISTTYRKIKAIPELGLPALIRTHSAGVPSVSSSVASSTRSASKKIKRDEPCLVTKQYGYSLEKAHFINAVRRDKSLKWDLEFFLHELGVVEDSFNLNSASNHAPLHRDLHYTLDKLGFFAITCSKSTLKAVIAEVDQENAKWQLKAAQHRRYIRDFLLDSPPFSTAQYEMVVMNPQHFLPKGAGFLVHTKQGSDLTHKVYVVAADGALRVGRQGDDERLPSFAGPNREAQDILNPFLVVLNADMAFRRFKRRPLPLCKEYSDLIELTRELAEKIYFKPLVQKIEKRIAEYVAPTKSGDEDVHMEGGDEFGAQTSKDNDETVTRKNVGKFSRLGRVVERPGPGASYEEMIEYRKYLMSGRDYELTSDHEDLLAELSSTSDSSE